MKLPRKLNHGGMGLPRTFDKLLALFSIFALSFTGGFAWQQNRTVDTYADTENGVYLEAEEYFVTFYDEGTKLTVKTDAPTVGEAIERAGIVLNETDIVEPGLTTEITVNNFFINIYRSRPAVVKDGVREAYVMTASYDPVTIAREAGLTIYDGDEVRAVVNTNFLEVGTAEMYEVTRNGGRTITVEEEIAFSEETVKDYNLAPGVREVRQLGEVGQRVLTYEVYYEDNVETRRELVADEVRREPVNRIVAVGVSEIERTPLTPSRGAQVYTVRVGDRVIERKETYYDLDMTLVMQNAARYCGVEPYYTVREDGVKVDAEGYVLVAAELSRYPRCSVVETSLGLGKVYDTGGFALTNPEQFDLATDWTNRNGR